MESKTNDTNELIYKRETESDIENKLMVTRGERGKGINWEIGIDIYTLLYIKYITWTSGGSVVKNPPANAGDTGSISGPGRSHMLRSS